MSLGFQLMLLLVSTPHILGQNGWSLSTGTEAYGIELLCQLVVEHVCIGLGDYMLGCICAKKIVGNLTVGGQVFCLMGST